MKTNENEIKTVLEKNNTAELSAKTANAELTEEVELTEAENDNAELAEEVESAEETTNKRVVKNFAVSTMDLKKILERGCKLCKGKQFSCYKLKEKAVCNNCGATYYRVAEGFLDHIAQPTAAFQVVRYSNIDNPGENYEVETTKVGYTRKKALHSAR